LELMVTFLLEQMQLASLLELEVTGAKADTDLSAVDSNKL